MLLPSTPIVHSRQWKGQVPYLSRYAPGRHLRRARQRPVGPPDRPRRLRATSGWSATSRPSWTPPARTRAVLVGLCGDGVWRAIELAAERPGARPGHRRLRASASRSSRRRTRGRSTCVVRRRAADRRGLGEAEPALLAPRLPGVRAVLLRARSPRSRTRRSRSRMPSSGRSTARSTRCSPTTERPFTPGPRGGRGDLPRGRLPDAHRPRHGGHLPADRAIAHASPS